MKPIIVKKENAERIMAEFAKAQGKATARTIDSYEQLADIIKGVNMRLYGISKKALEGVRIEYTFAQKFPNAYKYRPESTHFVLVYKNGAWQITNIIRHTCPNRVNNGYEYSLYLTDGAKEAVLNLYK